MTEHRRPLEGGMEVAEGMNKIEHLIILMMENRSFDHYLGSLSLLEGRTDVDGLRDDLPPVLDKDGKPVPLWNLETWNSLSKYCCYGDPPHSPAFQRAN